MSSWWPRFTQMSRSQASSSWSSASCISKAAARADFVRSSQVGPRPPVVMMSPARPCARPDASSMTRPGLSPHDRLPVTSMPYSDRSTGDVRRVQYLSCCRAAAPVPTEIISAFNVYPYPFDAFSASATRPLYVHGGLRRGDVLDPRLCLGVAGVKTVQQSS